MLPPLAGGGNSSAALDQAKGTKSLLSSAPANEKRNSPNKIESSSVASKALTYRDEPPAKETARGENPVEEDAQKAPSINTTQVAGSTTEDNKKETTQETKH